MLAVAVARTCDYTACKVGAIAYGMKEMPLAPEMFRQ
ncbi:hypothetical protein IWX62_001167 [Arthrobacter sp. CAN_A1]